MKASCTHELFEKQAKRRPEAVAVVFEDKHLTYGELDRRSNQLARYLRKLGVKADDLVGLYTEKSPEMIIGILGILKAGGAYVPLDPAYPATRLGLMLKTLDIDVVLTGITTKHFDSSSPVANVVSVRKKQIMFESDKKLETIKNQLNLFGAFFTSGSTGTPKAVALVDSAVKYRAVSRIKYLDLNKDSRVLSTFSFSFAASLWQICGTLMCGGCCIIVDDLFENINDKVFRYNITHLDGSFSIIISFLETESLKRRCVNLKRISITGEKVIFDRLRKFSEINVPKQESNYGLTECCGSVAQDTFKKIDGKSDIYLLDTRLDSAPMGATGEIYVRGLGLARGYLNRPDLTADRFIANPFGNGDRLYRTGDLGRYLSDGNIEFFGRTDNQVKIRGFRVEPGEVESAINECDQVKTSVALAKDGQLVAYIVPSDVRDLVESYKFETQQDEDITVFAGENAAELVEAVRSKISQKLPEYMIPIYFVVLEKIPLTPNGKTDGKLLQTLDTGRRLIVDEYVAPGNEVEQKLCDIWRDVLHLDKVGINDNFFKVGGHSLLATRIISKIRAELEIDISLKSLFEYPTILGLAEVAKEYKGREKIPPLVSQKKPEFIPLSFAQQRLWVIDQLLPNKAVYNIPYAIRLNGKLDYKVLEESINNPNFG